MFSCFFFFFKQKTAYEMRISDWSSDVCSSDLCSTPWGIQDQGVLHATVSLAEQALPPTSATQRSGWLNFAIPYPALRRHTAILTGEIGRASCRERVCKYV